MSVTESHYDARYFDSQKSVGALSAIVDRDKFAEWIAPDNVVLDFGAGGGFMLRALVQDPNKRIAVEVNPAARSFMASQDTDAYNDMGAICNHVVNVVISDSALEHVSNPHFIASEMYKVLAPGGLAVIVVPCEGLFTRDLGPTDPDKHLFSWSPGALANLFRDVGFEVLQCKPFLRRWPPKAILVHSLIGTRLFRWVCQLWGIICVPKIAQVRLVALKRK